MTETRNPSLGPALVLGGCGYLGSHIVEALHSDGSFFPIIAASRNPTRCHIPEASYKPCDITDETQVLKLLDEVQPIIIFHSVAPDANESEDVQYRINYESTKRLLEIARKHVAVKALIYAGSARSVASESHSRSTPLTEDVAVLHDLSSNGSPYERTKGAADSLTLKMNTPKSSEKESKGYQGMLLTAVIRVPALYGRRDLRTSARILQRANTRATRVQLGNNQAKHEWLYLENAAHAHVLAAKALVDTQRGEKDARVDGEAFFVTDGAPLRFWDFSRKMWVAAGDESCTNPQNIREIPMGLAVAIATLVEWTLWIFTIGRVRPTLSAPQLRYIDRGSWWSIDKARVRLGYEPLCSTDEGIQRTVEWFQHNKDI